jgi:hypothetical protein
VNKDVEQYIRAARAQGITVRLTRSGHYLCTAQDGRRESIPQTPRGGKSLIGVRAKLRRLGARL